MLNRADEHITIKPANNTDIVSIDRVKPSFTEKAALTTSAPSDASTDSSEPSPDGQPATATPPKKQISSKQKVAFPRKFKGGRPYRTVSATLSKNPHFKKRKIIHDVSKTITSYLRIERKFSSNTRTIFRNKLTLRINSEIVSYHRIKYIVFKSPSS